MRTTVFSLSTLLVAGIAAVAMLIFGMTAVRAFEAPYEEELSIEQVAGLVPIVHGSSTESIASRQDEGMRLRVPSADIDASITIVGIGVSGNMAVPRSYSDVGLYRYGPHPGDVGSAVIDGHLDTGFGLPAVFHALDTVTVGDSLYIDKSDGTTLRFEVTAVTSYDAAEVPLDLLFNRRDERYLNLITCDGTWSSREDGYDKRLVVFSRLVEE